LTGIHLGHYGVEWSSGRPKSQWLRLSHLVERLAGLPGEFRIRLSSIEATEVTRELIRVMADHPRRVCPHLHISMQSGSDAVLRRMRRRWGSRRFVDRCHLVQKTLDEPAMTTDIIVGFPGETEDDFAVTCRVAEEVGFSKIHIFPFSPRRTTPAAAMSGQVAPAVKSDRVNRLAELERRLRDQYFARLLGRELEVLVESSAGEPGRMIGTSCRYAPVELPGRERDAGRFVLATAQRVADGRIEAY
jgi:threonylcarbamoyladenosine tRNA methylthiotransferase MtaB